MEKTALNQVHKDQGGKMVDFAGFDMPIQYKLGILKEHQWVRDGNVGLFDVSHMGQVIIEGENLAQFFAKITPSYFETAKNALAKYTVLTNEEGGIIDDLIITKLSDNKFFVVINAACKQKDLAWIKSHLPADANLTQLDDRALIAVQGQKAQEVLQNLVNENLEELPYMNMGNFTLKDGTEIFISRTGYTGEDGFEVSIENQKASDFWLELSKNDAVESIGLGARDTLRLEVGYPLYGNDLSDKTSPIEAALSWVVSKNNQNFIGCEKILAQKQNGVAKKRVGIKLQGKGVIRQGMSIENEQGQEIGVLTSGGFSPVLKASIGQAYLEKEFAVNDNQVNVIIRGKKVAAKVQSFVFVAPRTRSLKK